MGVACACACTFPDYSGLSDAYVVQDGIYMECEGNAAVGSMQCGKGLDRSNSCEEAHTSTRVILILEQKHKNKSRIQTYASVDSAILTSQLEYL